MNYMPSINDSIATKATTQEVSFQSKTKDVSTAPGKKGELVVGIFASKGYTLGGKGQTATTVTVTGPEGVSFEAGETTIADALGKKRKLLQLKFTAGKDAKSGVATVQVTYQARQGEESGETQTATFTVPIEIK